jgi:hypothetical protein
VREHELAELAEVARAALAKELARRRRLFGSRGCSLCGAWWDVIHIEDGDGTLHEVWHDWEPHGGRCSQCGREPLVLTVRFAYAVYELANVRTAPAMGEKWTRSATKRTSRRA